MEIKGKSLLEWSIVIFIALVVTFIIVGIVATLARGENYCEFYRYSTIQDTPVSCFDYLTNPKNYENR